MAQHLIADLPKDIVLSSDFIVRITAVDSATGSLVSGVNVSNVVISALDVSSGQIITGSPGDLSMLAIFDVPGTGT